MEDKLIQPQQLGEVTDSVMLRELARQGTNKDDVEFHRDYAANSPYTKLYLNKKNGTRYAVISGLPMVDRKGNKVKPAWRTTGEHRYTNTSNLFTVNVDHEDIEVEMLFDQPSGVQAGAKVSYHPTLSGVIAIEPTIQVLPIDPLNSNYIRNTIEWDYGFYKRRLREIEGRLQGYWVFDSDPGVDVTIRYNQSGDFRLQLGIYTIDEDTEFISADEFAKQDYPFIVWDTLTVYPDADPESATVDGQLGYEGGTQLLWATLIALDGSGAYMQKYDNIAENYIVQFSTGGSNTYWDKLVRGIFLFDTSGLTALANISAATFSIYGTAQTNDGSWASTLNVYSSSPASNTSIAVTDFNDIGSTAFCDSPIAYGSYNTSGYNDFAFNATGIAAISKTGVTKLGLREAAFDVSGTPPSWTDINHDLVYRCYSADQGGATKPKLVVTYTTINVSSSVSSLIAQGVI